MREEMRTFGYLCPECGRTVMGSRSVFALAASNAEVECECGKSALKVTYDGQRYHAFVPCGICKETHEAIVPEVLGYNEINTRKGHNSRERDLNALSCAVDFLHSSRNGDKPFFLSFGMSSTHMVYEEAKDIEEDFVIPPFPVVNNKETRHDFSCYLQSLKTADECLGVLLDEIDRLGLRENTVVMFTTDHGISFPEMKCTLKDTGTGVALFLRHPEIGRGSSDALVSHIDIFPTICEMLGLEKPEWLQGTSLMPLMRGNVEKVHDYIFSEITYHASYEPTRAVRTDRLKLIRHFAEDRHKPLANIGDHISKDWYLSSPLSKIEEKRDCLYDLVADPAEKINVVDLPEYQADYKRLSAVLEEWMRDTNDPLLDGPINLQPGQIVNRTDALSPFEPTYDCGGNPVTAKELKEAFKNQ